MISFLIKGILRDRSKSLIPIVIISIGVTLTVLTTGYVTGALSDIVDQNAKLDTGHLKVMTKPYAENKDQIPNDLALLGLEELTASLQTQFPDVLWTPRIRFWRNHRCTRPKRRHQKPRSRNGLSCEFIKSQFR